MICTSPSLLHQSGRRRLCLGIFTLLFTWMETDVVEASRLIAMALPSLFSTGTVQPASRLTRMMLNGDARESGRYDAISIQLRFSVVGLTGQSTAVPLLELLPTRLLIST